MNALIWRLYMVRNIEERERERDEKERERGRRDIYREIVELRKRC